jgi:hypothetical protein
MTSTLSIDKFSKKNVLISLKNDNAYKRWNKLITDLGGTWNKSNDDPGWILPQDKVEIFENMLAKYGSRRMKSSRMRQKYESDEDDEQNKKKGSRFRKNPKLFSRDVNENDMQDDIDDDMSAGESGIYSDSRNQESDSDDELIQATLARRLMSESSQKSIEEEEILNSDLEDVVSSMRRMRHMYTVIKSLRVRIKNLEDKLEAAVPMLV